MKTLDTSYLNKWPDDVVLGETGIEEAHSTDILSPPELEEFQGFTNPRRKGEYLSVRHFFYRLLNEKNIGFDQVSLTKEKLGKPFAQIGDRRVYVSFSHSQEKVYCAVSLANDIGLDAEHLQRNVGDKVVKRMLNKHEWSELSEEDPLRLWTIKEAVVKCMGTGLRTNMHELSIQKNKEDEFSVKFNNDKLFEICSFKETDHQIALAYHSEHI